MSTTNVIHIFTHRVAGTQDRDRQNARVLREYGLRARTAPATTETTQLGQQESGKLYILRPQQEEV